MLVLLGLGVVGVLLRGGVMGEWRCLIWGSGLMLGRTW